MLLFKGAKDKHVSVIYHSMTRKIGQEISMQRKCRDVTILYYKEYDLAAWDIERSDHEEETIRGS